MSAPNADRSRDLYRQMLRIRRFEERCGELYKEQKIRGFLHLYIGEEAIAAGVMPQLGKTDAVVATYREHGHALARGVSMRAIMAEMFGKQEGCSKGRGGSMHLFDVARGFYGGHGIVAACLPITVGLALAKKRLSEDGVAVCFFGEGAVAEGEFHESINLAALWQLPALFVCENNRYAMGTALERSESETDIHAKAAAYRIKSEVVDGMDVVAVSEAARKAVTALRKERRPYFLECRTYRFRAHSMFDPELYRDKAEVEQWKQKCPLEAFRRKLEKAGTLGAADFDTLEREVAAEVEDAAQFAEQGTLEPEANLLTDVTAPRSAP